jgi:hypothetical protein
MQVITMFLQVIRLTIGNKLFIIKKHRQKQLFPNIHKHVNHLKSSKSTPTTTPKREKPGSNHLKTTGNFFILYITPANLMSPTCVLNPFCRKLRANCLFKKPL